MPSLWKTEVTGRKAARLGRLPPVGVPAPRTGFGSRSAQGLLSARTSRSFVPASRQSAGALLVSLPRAQVHVPEDRCPLFGVTRAHTFPDDSAPAARRSGQGRDAAIPCPPVDRAGLVGRVGQITYLVIHVKNIRRTPPFHHSCRYDRRGSLCERVGMTEQAPLNTSPLPVKLRIEDYLLLDRAGAFDTYAKTELIDGEIFFMNAQHRPHARLKTKLYDLLRDSLRELASQLVPLVEVSVELPPSGVPEPDIVVTAEPDGEGLVPLGSVALVLEVSDTTLGNDLGRKASLYARHRIPEYWVADLEARVIHQLWNPKGEAYAERREVAFGQMLEAATIAGLAVSTNDL